MKRTLYIDLPADFSFKSTVYSHGWCELAPFSLDEQNWRLSYVFRDVNGNSVPADIREYESRLEIELEEAPADEADLVAQTRHLLRLDEDLAGFYEVVTGHDRFKWIGQHRAGR